MKYVAMVIFLAALAAGGLFYRHKQQQKEAAKNTPAPAPVAPGTPPGSPQAGLPTAPQAPQPNANPAADGPHTGELSKDECSAAIDHVIALPSSGQFQMAHDDMVANRDKRVSECLDKGKKADIPCVMGASTWEALTACFPPPTAPPSDPNAQQAPGGPPSTPPLPGAENVPPPPPMDKTSPPPPDSPPGGQPPPAPPLTPPPSEGPPPTRP